MKSSAAYLLRVSQCLSARRRSRVAPPRKVGLLPALLLAALSAHCGFLAQPRVSEAYIEAFAPEDATECLVTWPIHAVALPITATIDQGARTVEAALPAGRDALDFFWLDISDDNLMLSRTIAVPKLLVTPGIFLGSYIARWFYPLDAEDQPFGDYENNLEAEGDAEYEPGDEYYDQGESSDPAFEEPPEKKPEPGDGPRPIRKSPAPRTAEPGRDSSETEAPESFEDSEDF